MIVLPYYNKILQERGLFRKNMIMTDSFFKQNPFSVLIIILLVSERTHCRNKTKNITIETTYTDNEDQCIFWIILTARAKSFSPTHFDVSGYAKCNVCKSCMSHTISQRNLHNLRLVFVHYHPLCLYVNNERKE